MRAGADAVYFGLPASTPAPGPPTSARRARPTPGAPAPPRCEGLRRAQHPALRRRAATRREAIAACARAGVDAVIVQDLGVAALVRAAGARAAVHASTQMTLHRAAAMELPAALGAEPGGAGPRAVAGRRSPQSARPTDVEWRCSCTAPCASPTRGQCLTSEALGGRSANRGALRPGLPAALRAGRRRAAARPRRQGVPASPAGSRGLGLVPRAGRARASARCKIEGRLKGPEYVAATTQLYRAALDAAWAGPRRRGARNAPCRCTAAARGRGSWPGWITSALSMAAPASTAGCAWAPPAASQARRSTAPAGRLSSHVALGDGVVVAGGREGAGELGGRVWRLVVDGREQPRAPAGPEVLVWLGPRVTLPAAAASLAAAGLHRTSDPAAEQAGAGGARRAATGGPAPAALRGGRGARATRRPAASAVTAAVVETDVPLGPRRGAVLDEARRRGPSSAGWVARPFHLGELTLDLPPGVGLPLSALNRARRALVEALADRLRRAPGCPRWPPASCWPRPPARPAAAARRALRAVPQPRSGAGGAGRRRRWRLPRHPRADRHRRRLPRAARRGGAVSGLAPPRIRKPGEEKIDRFLRGLGPAALLVRGLGALHELARSRAGDPRPAGRWRWGTSL